MRSLNGGWVLYFGLVVVAVGLLFESAELIAASTLIILTVLALSLSTRLQEAVVHFALRGSRRVVGTGEVLLQGRPVSVEVAVENPTPLSIPRAVILDLPPDRFTADARPTQAMLLGALGRQTVAYRAVPQVPGRAVFPGIDLWFSDPVGLHFSETLVPVRSELEVYPSPMAAGAVSAIEVRRTSELIGQQRGRAQAIGYDFVGTRDYLPGDPFKLVEWKTSARTGSLRTRETQSEIRLPIILVLDVSSSMASGLRRSKIAHSVAQVAALAQLALRGQSPVGLYLFSDRLRDIVPIRLGPGQLPAILRALMRAEELAREALRASAPYRRLLGRTAAYLALTHPERFRLGRVGRLGESRLLAFVARSLGLPRPQRRGLRRQPAVARELLQAFWSREAGHVPLVGVEEGTALPSDVQGKGAGLGEALRAALLRTPGKSWFLLITDGEGLQADPLLRGHFNLLRSAHHEVAVLSPSSPRFDEGTLGIADLAAHQAADADLVAAAPIAEGELRLLLEEAQRPWEDLLGQCGIPLLRLGPSDSAVGALASLVDRRGMPRPEPRR